MMLIYYEREVSKPRNNEIYIDASSEQKVLKDENMAWRMARASKPVSFRSETDLSYIRFANEYQKFPKNSVQQKHIII